VFGLTFEKLVVIGVIAAMVLGPERLPRYAELLGTWVRKLRHSTTGAKARLREELGEDFDDIDWKKLNPRQYDPRQIVRNALMDDGPLFGEQPTERVVPAPQEPEEKPASMPSASKPTLPNASS
jgi:sec-independent protein translocase protein TatB